MRKRPTDTDTNVNRIRSAVDEMTGLADPDDRMLGVLELLTPSSAREVIPGKYICLYTTQKHQIFFTIQIHSLLLLMYSSGDSED